MNQVGGKAEWFGVPLASWLGHPSGPIVDVCVTPLSTNFPWNELDHLWYPLVGAVTPEGIANDNIGVGEEVLAIGLFHHRAGNRENIPIARVGNIAAMAEESVLTPIGEIDAFLIECRSIGGLSGSPVFVHLGAIRIVKGQLARSPIAEGTFYLLGLMFGHFDEKDDLVDDAVGGSNRINLGIGIVVPVGRILEMVSQDQIATCERQAEKVLREKRMPTMDSVEQQDELAFTKEDFEAALKKVSRKLEPGK